MIKESPTRNASFARVGDIIIFVNVCHVLSAHSKAA